MNILFLARRFYPDVGGVEKHVLEISKRLASQGQKITIITQSQNSNKKDILASNISIIRIPQHGRKNEKFFIWRWFWKNRNLLQAADIIHCHDVFYWYFPFRFLYPQKPVFTTFHGYESYPIKIKAIVVRKISEALSFGNICIGDFIKKWYDTKPTIVSYGAVDRSKFEVQSTKLSKESAVFFGRLDEQTGVETYVKAFEILKEKYPKFEMLVVGDGKYKKRIEKKVKVIGFQDTVEKYLHRYRFAFVSRYLSILEAFAAKRLVFALYDNPVKEDYLRMTPFAKYMIIEKDPEKLVRKVEFIMDHPKVEKKMIESAYSFVKKQTWDNLVVLYLNLWKQEKTSNLTQKKKIFSGSIAFIFSIILFLACILYQINLPYVGPNATTANAYSLIAHNFVKFGYLQTKFAPVISISPYLPKEPVYYFHHPVLLSFTESLLFRVFGEGFWVGRLSVILFTFGSFILLYFIGKESADKKFGFFAFLTASLIPGYTIFGKLIDHEPLVLFYCLLSLFIILKYFHENKKGYIVMALFISALGVMSDWPAVYFLPCFLPLFFKYKKIRVAGLLFLSSFLVIAFLLGSIYFIRPIEFLELWEPIQHSSIHNLLVVPEWPLRFFATTSIRTLIYFSPLLVIFALINIYTIVKNIKRKQISDKDLVISGFAIFGGFHVLLYSYASFTHPYLVYYLIPFVAFSSAMFLQRYYEKKSYKFLFMIFLFCFLYLITIQVYKNKQILADLWRYQLIVAVSKYLAPYEEVQVNGLSALNSDTFWRFSIITLGNDNVYSLDTKKYKHYIHSCPQICKSDDVQVRYLKKRYNYKHFINSGGEAYIFFIQQTKISSEHETINLSQSDQQVNKKENIFDKKVHDIYRRLRDALHVPQF